MPAATPTLSLSRPLLFAAGAIALALAATIALWVYYGTAVFFETIRTGWAACF